MYNRKIQKLIDIFCGFPTIGPKTAARFVFFLMQKPESEIDELIKAIADLRNINICKNCFNSFEPARSDYATGVACGEPTQEYCEICTSQARNKKMLCIVEKETDLAFIEKTKSYNGLYFILGGTVSNFKKESVEKIRVKELLERLKDKQIEEIILALNSTSEGEATILYLEKILQPLGKKLSRLGRGLPVGAEIEYADDETISSALQNRK